MDSNRLYLFIMDFKDEKMNRVIIHFYWILIDYFCNFMNTDYKMTI